MECNKTTKTKAQFRIKQIEVQGKEAIDSVIITYDDGSIWCHGVGGEKASGDTVIFTENEHLVRVTHEPLENTRCAAAALELETNKGRIFSFEPVCSTLPKHKRTTVTSDDGMEIVSLKIRAGILVGYEQQTCDIDSVAPAKEWYNILYHGTKEEEEERREFYSRQEADVLWGEVSKKCQDKVGRGAIYLDTKQNKILNKTGDKPTVTHLISAAEKVGIYLNYMNNGTKLGFRDALSAISKSLVTKKDTVRLMLIIAGLLVSDMIKLEAVAITGQIITLLTNNNTDLYQNHYANAVCRNVLHCVKDNRHDYVTSMVLCYFLMVISESLIYHGDIFAIIINVLKLEGALKAAALQKALSLDHSYHDTHTAADIDSSTNVESMANTLTWNVAFIVARLVNLVTCAWYMVAVTPDFGGAVVLIMGLFCVLYIIPINNRLERLETQKRKFNTLAKDLRFEAVNFISTVKQFSNEDFHNKKQEIAEETCHQSKNLIAFLRIQVDYVHDGLRYAVLAAIMYFQIPKSSSSFNAGNFMASYLLVERFTFLFRSLCFHLPKLQEDVPAIESFVDFMKTSSQIVSGKESVDSLEGDIKFEGVHFCYPSRPADKVLSGLNLTIQWNKMTAIVGDSGSGKSTLAKLLMRLYDPQEGRITLGGQDIRRFNLNELHGNITLVSQNPELLNTSLSDNIAYGATAPDKVTEERIEAAARLANCGFIDKFRNGMETFAGAQGLQLSGGQKQRIAIARAAMRDPEILILDEATSALDAQNEREVQEALDKLMSNKTTIVIAHRLSTVRHADEILCLKDGAVVEKGTHEELMELGGNYANLVSKQLVEDNYNRLKDKPMNVVLKKSLNDEFLLEDIPNIGTTSASPLASPAGDPLANAIY